MSSVVELQKKSAKISAEARAAYAKSQQKSPTKMKAFSFGCWNSAPPVDAWSGAPGIISSAPRMSFTIGAEKPLDLKNPRVAYVFITHDLESTDTGRYSTLTHARKLGQRIDTSIKGRKILLACRKYLRAAAQSLENYGFFDQLSGVMTANISLLEANLDSINRAEKQLPEDPSAKLDPKLAAKIGLISLQTLDNLNFTRKISSQTSSIIDDFGDAMAEVLAAAINKLVLPILKQVPKVAAPVLPIALAIGGFLILKDVVTKKLAS